MRPPDIGPRVVVYIGQGCHLCALALEAVRGACGDAFEVVDITGVAELEATYRGRIPVVSLDGAPVFTFFVDETALRALLSRSPGNGVAPPRSGA